MNNRNIFVVLVVLCLALFILPFRKIEWGKFRWLQSETVTVTGEAKTTQKNQIASFNAGVNVIKEKKEEAVAEANQKMDALIKAVKDFGIPEKDIETQNMSVYQQQEQIYSGVRTPTTNKASQWVVNNSIAITLRDTNKVNDLANLLNTSGANNVYGPNFRMDDTNEIEKTLYNEAIEDAKEKATLIAKASGRKLGKVVTVNDNGVSGSVYPVYALKSSADSGMGGGAVAEPGSATINKSMTVVFEFN